MKVVVALSLVILTVSVATLHAQQPPAGRGQGAGRGAAPAPPPPTPRAAAPVDLTGYWVSIVTEDWRWRMITPPKGDYASVPINNEGRRIADMWDPSKEGSCEAYGAGAIMRMPGRLHITWENDTTLKIETDAGQQTRLFSFDRTRTPPVERTLQGFSVAEFERPPAGRGPAPPLRWATLKVMTTNLRPGWLRKNGVPYSENAVVTEYFDRHSEGDAGEWFTVTTTVDDPKYLAQPFIVSSSFRREPDGSKFKPAPCK
jgi:hypothetical protein